MAKLRSPRACSDLLTQEKAEQDEELQLVHEDQEDLAAELQALEQRMRPEELRHPVEARNRQQPLWRRRNLV